VHCNSTIDKNTEVSILGDNPSGWGTPCSQNIVMPLNQEKVGTTIDSCSNETYIIAKSVKNNSHMVGNEMEVATEEDKLSSWGTPWSINTGNISNPHNRNSCRFFSSSQSSMHLDQLQQKSREYSWKNASYLGADMQKPCPNALPSYAARKAPPSSFPSDTLRRAPYT